MSFFKNLKKAKAKATPIYYESPPEWTPAPETSHTLGKYWDATDDDYRQGEAFCNQYPPDAPRPVPSAAIEAIQTQRACAWNISQPLETNRFKGHIDNPGGKEKKRPVAIVHTDVPCRETCILSNLPLVAGMYEVQGKVGVYYEIRVHKMGGSIAIGTACQPYPPFRFPGWNRLSAALHLDDFRKFFEDPDGGRDYSFPVSKLEPEDIIGCGYEFRTGSIFFTYNGLKLADAFNGIYLPRHNYDVFAAIGVEGASDFEVNFGGELFSWLPGNEWQWMVDGLAGKFSNMDGPDEELPAYSRMA